jgi:tetratricopeptide (TPR) repeat protein
VQLKEAEDLLDELRRRFDTVPAYREALAQVLIRSSRAYGPFATSGIDELPRLRKAIVLLEELVRQFPDNMQYLRDLADARIQHVDLREAEPHTEPVLLEMIEDLTAAVAEFQSYLQTTDGPRDEWLLLADHYRRLAERLDQAGRLVEAEAAVRKRAAITRRAR